MERGGSSLVRDGVAMALNIAANAATFNIIGLVQVSGHLVAMI
jgi:hypothetical protein